MERVGAGDAFGEKRIWRDGCGRIPHLRLHVDGRDERVGVAGHKVHGDVDPGVVREFDRVRPREFDGDQERPREFDGDQERLRVSDIDQRRPKESDTDHRRPRESDLEQRRPRERRRSREIEKVKHRAREIERVGKSSREIDRDRERSRVIKSGERSRAIERKPGVHGAGWEYACPCVADGVCVCVCVGDFA